MAKDGSIYGFAWKYARPKFDDGSSCSPLKKWQFYGYTMVYPMFRRTQKLKDPSSSWKRRHESLPTQRPAHFLHRRLYLGKMELIWAVSSSKLGREACVYNSEWANCSEVQTEIEATLTSTNVEPTKNYDFDKQKVDPFLTKNVDACRQELQKVCNHRNR